MIMIDASDDDGTRLHSRWPFELQDSPPSRIQLTCTDGNLSFGGPLAEFKQMTILSGVCMMHDV